MQGQADTQQDPNGTTPPASSGSGAPLSLSPASSKSSGLEPNYLLFNLRRLLNLSQQEMGLKVGYSFSHLSRIERGEWPMTPELTANLIPLLKQAQDKINADQSILDALRRIYDPPAE